MSTGKPTINLEKALRELSLEMSHQYEAVDHPLTEINSNIPFTLPSNKDIPRKASTHQLQKSTKKIINKENQADHCSIPQQTKIEGAEVQVGRSGTYVAISKALEQKTQLIGQQKHQIEMLRKCVEDVRHSKESRISEEARAKSEELAALKIKQKEYLQGLSQILGLKENLEDIKRKYQQISAEKNSLQQERNSLISERNSLLSQRNLLSTRCNTLFLESEELTIAIAHLKQEKEERETTIRGFEEEVVTLREHLKEKNILEQRALTFECRMNQCLGKLSETQQQHSAYQLKYYRLQQQCDTIRQDCEQRLASAHRQCRTQREEHEQQVNKLTASIRNAEQRILQQEKTICDLQESRRRRQQNIQVSRLTESLEEAQKINSRLQEQGRKWESYTKQLTKHYQQEKDTLTVQAHTSRTETVKFRDEINSLASQLQTVTAERDAAEQKSLELLNERERMLTHFSGVLNQKEEEVKHNRLMITRTEDALAEARSKLEQKSKQEEQIFRKIEEVECRLIEETQRLSDQNALLQQQNQATSNLLAKTASQRDALTSQKTALREQMRVIRDRQQSEVRYYQQKYQQQLSEYNSLSQYSHSIELENASLLRTNTTNLLEISSCKGEIAQLHADLSKLIANSNSNDPQITTLVAELSEMKQQFAELVAEMTDVKAEAVRWQVEAANAQADNSRLRQELQIAQQDSVEWSKRAEDRQVVIRQVRGELAAHVEEIRRLKANITAIQEKYRNLVQQHREQLAQWESFSVAARQQNNQLQNSRLSVQYELDNSQATIAILREENAQLHRIFSSELDRRNCIIRELMAEKRSLYSQLVGSRTLENDNNK